MAIQKPDIYYAILYRGKTILFNRKLNATYFHMDCRSGAKYREYPLSRGNALLMDNKAVMGD